MSRCELGRTAGEARAADGPRRVSLGALRRPVTTSAPLPSSGATQPQRGEGAALRVLMRMHEEAREALTRVLRRRALLLPTFAALLLALPALAQAPDLDPATTPAAWCRIARSDDPERATACDAGAAVRLVGWRRLALVAVLGSGTVGAGVAVRTSGRFAVGAGVAAPWTVERGVEVDDWGLFVGATIRWDRRGG